VLALDQYTTDLTAQARAGKIDPTLGRDAEIRQMVDIPHALEAVAEAVRTSRAGLTDPRKPVGVFLIVDTSGVGKMETALTLADLLYGGEQNLTTINMSEFKEEHKVSLLMGSPPGYVGRGEDSIPGVQDVFY